MKVAVECHSPLLQRSLEIFLDEYLVNKKSCEIVIKDVIPPEGSEEDSRSFYIGSCEGVDLGKPFSKSQLLDALHKRFSPQIQSVVDDVMDFNVLERRIEMLTQEYQQNIIKAVRAFYEK